MTLTTDLNATRHIASSIARQAGVLLRRYFRQPIAQRTKRNFSDIVTEADEAAERAIVESILAAYPTHHVIGEEGGGMGAPRERAEYCWYVDPLDGTTNFAHGLPHFSVSIAITDANNQPLIGVVYQPMLNELFSAAAGQGATLNNKPIRVSTRSDLASCVLASGFPFDKASNPDNNVRQWGHFVARTRGMRRSGSAALDLAYIAGGWLDGYWERSINPWDYMAGLLCVREAGGMVSDYTGDRDANILREGHIVASNGLIHDAMLAGIHQLES